MIKHIGNTGDNFARKTKYCFVNLIGDSEGGLGVGSVRLSVVAKGDLGDCIALVANKSSFLIDGNFKPTYFAYYAKNCVFKTHDKTIYKYIVRQVPKFKFNRVQLLSKSDRILRFRLI